MRIDSWMTDLAAANNADWMALVEGLYLQFSVNAFAGPSVSWSFQRLGSARYVDCAFDWRAKTPRVLPLGMPARGLTVKVS